MKLFVSNIDYDATEDDVRKVFELADCDPQKVKIIHDRDTGYSRGFGFVEVEDGPNAIASVDGVILNGRRLSVREAKPENRPGREKAHAAHR